MQQKMLYQKHSLRILNFHVQAFFLMKIQPFISFLWHERWDEAVDNQLHDIIPQIDEKYYSECKIQKMKLLLIALGQVIRVKRIHSDWKIDLIPQYVISVKGITS